MRQDLQSLEPVEGAKRSLRRRLTLKDELLLALLPTLTVLFVFALVEVVARQRLLFATLAASAFLIYLDPQHGANAVKTLILAQLTAAALGLVIFLGLGPGYLSGGIAMTTTIVLMIMLDVMHPPAVSTSLIFAFKAGDESNLVLFALAVGITALLVVLERWTLWILARFRGQ
jgi:CBS-domain-containing membrane protein